MLNYIVSDVEKSWISVVGWFNRHCFRKSPVRMRTKLMKWSAIRLHFTQKASFSQSWKKSGSEAVKKGERSVNQIKNKVESMHLQG